MKSKYKFKKLLAIGGTALASGMIFASAQGFGGEMKMDADTLTKRFEKDAKVLNVSVDQVKEGWVNGKNIFDLAKDLGISTSTLEANLKTAREADIKSELSTLVSKGIITQAQADKRFEVMKNKVQNKKGEKGIKGKMMRGGDMKENSR